MTSQSWAVLVASLLAPSDVARSGAASELADTSLQWRCEVQQKWECELPGGCRELEIRAGSWLRLDLRRSTYERCDGFGCDSYDAIVSQEGLFTYARLRGRPDVFLKVGLAGLFVDVAAAGVSSINSLGVCTPDEAG